MRNIILGTLIISVLVFVAITMQRAAAGSRAELRTLSNAVGASTQPVGSSSTRFPSLAAQRSDEWKSYETMHDYFVDIFVHSPGKGLTRVPLAFERFRNQRLNAGGIRWAVGQVDLISTQNADRPFIYVSDSLNPSRHDLRHYKHVPLSVGELDAIDQIGKGKQVVCITDPYRPELIGAIHMQSSCAKCHEAKVGDLLGAFRYPLVREHSVGKDPAPPTPPVASR